MNSFNNEVPRGLRIPVSQEDLDTLEVPILTQEIIENTKNNVSSIDRPASKLELVTKTEVLVLDVMDEYQTKGLNETFIKKELNKLAETLRESKNPDTEIKDELREVLNRWRIPTKTEDHKAA